MNLKSMSSSCIFQAFNMIKLSRSYFVKVICSEILYQITLFTPFVHAVQFVGNANFFYIYDDRQSQTFATIRSCNRVNQLCIRFIRKPEYKFFIWFKPRGLRTLYSDSPASNSHFSFGIKLMRRIKLLSHSNAGEHMSGRCSRTYNRTELWLIQEGI